MKKLLLCAVLMVSALVFTACVSFPAPAVYDDSVPGSEQAVLYVAPEITVISFDGYDVKWNATATHSIPAGEHQVEFTYKETYDTGMYRQTYTDTQNRLFTFAPTKVYRLARSTVSPQVRGQEYSLDSFGVTKDAIAGENETLVTFVRKDLMQARTNVYVDGKKVTTVDPNGGTARVLLSPGKHLFEGCFTMEGQSYGFGMYGTKEYRKGEPVEIEVDSTAEMFITIKGGSTLVPPKFVLTSK
jgi:hypothetical protein